MTAMKTTMQKWTEHPTTYTLTRQEWLDINRALAGAALQMTRGRDMERRDIRLQRIRKAQDIMGHSYDRATKEMNNGN